MCYYLLQDVTMALADLEAGVHLVELHVDGSQRVSMFVSLKRARPQRLKLCLAPVRREHIRPLEVVHALFHGREARSAS